MYLDKIQEQIEQFKCVWTPYYDTLISILAYKLNYITWNKDIKNRNKPFTLLLQNKIFIYRMLS